MRSPEFRREPGRRSGRLAGDTYQYLAPESFTVLGAPPPEDEPPRAPEPFRLTPSKRRNKNQAFSILAEPSGNEDSRSGSPTGRVSPFRGRGFNPAGSRHASPAASPTPPFSPENQSSKVKSHIPVRRGSSENLLIKGSHQHARGSTDNISQRISHQYVKHLPPQHSRSMTNIAPRHLSTKPPPSPRRALNGSFVRLSPIIGSSPDGSDQYQSSPSRIPRSKSQPPSRVVSPGTSKTPSRNASRPVSRNPSRNPSRDTSPETPTRMARSSYKHIPAKIDSFSRAQKPRLPQKPKVNIIQPSFDRSRPPLSRRPSRGGVDSDDTDKENGNGRRGGGLHPYRPPQGVSKVQSRLRVDQNRNGRDTNRNGRDSNRSSPNRNGRETNRSDPNRNGRDTNSRNGRDANGRNDQSRNAKNEYNGRGGTLKKDDQKGKTNNGRPLRREDSRTTKATIEKASTSKTSDSKPTSKTNSPNGRNNATKRAKDNFDEILVDQSSLDEKDDDILSVTIDLSDGPTTAEIVSATTAAVTQPLKVEAKLMKPSEVLDAEMKAKVVQVAEKISDVGSSVKDSVSNPTTKSSSNPSVADPTNGNTTTKEPTQTKPATINPEPTPPIKTNASNISAPTATNPTTLNSLPEPKETNETKDTLNNNSKPVNLTTPVVDPKNLNNGKTPDHEKVNKAFVGTTVLNNSANEKMKQARTVVVEEIRPIKIMVREKSSDLEVQSGNVVLPRSATNGLSEKPMVPPQNPTQNSMDQPEVEPQKPKLFSRIIGGIREKMPGKCLSKDKAESIAEEAQEVEEPEMEAPAKTGCFNCRKAKTESTKSLQNVRVELEDEKPKKCWDRMNCCKGNKVYDKQEGVGCFPKMKKDSNRLDESWAERRDSILSDTPKDQGKCASLKRIFCCLPCCSKCRRKSTDMSKDDAFRRTSMASKKKSLTTTSTMQAPPPEDIGSKLDNNLIEHTSHMRGAIPVLPIPLAWLCAILNIFLPGIGTILSGMICLCIGRPRFSAKDSAKGRVGAFFIDVIVGISQLFTVLFCLVGWGWSIWWGVIMIKVSRKYKKIKIAEKLQEENEAPPTTVNHRDAERGH